MEYKLGNIGVGWSVVLCILVWFRQTQYFYEKDGRTANGANIFGANSQRHIWRPTTNVL